MASNFEINVWLAPKFFSKEIREHVNGFASVIGQHCANSDSWSPKGPLNNRPLPRCRDVICFSYRWKWLISKRTQSGFIYRAPGSSSTGLGDKTVLEGCKSRRRSTQPRHSARSIQFSRRTELIPPGLLNRGPREWTSHDRRFAVLRAVKAEAGEPSRAIATLESDTSAKNKRRN